MKVTYGPFVLSKAPSESHENLGRAFLDLKDGGLAFRLQSGASWLKLGGKEPIDSGPLEHGVVLPALLWKFEPVGAPLEPSGNQGPVKGDFIFCENGSAGLLLYAQRGADSVQIFDFSDQSVKSASIGWSLHYFNNYRIHGFEEGQDNATVIIDAAVVVEVNE